MSAVKIITTPCGHVLGTHSVTDGFVPAKRKELRRLNDDEATCWAMWLQNRYGWEAAYEFIDEWTTGKLYTTH